jgi:hypothetical protein
MRTGGRQFDVNDSVVNIDSRPTAPTLETQEMLTTERDSAPAKTPAPCDWQDALRKGLGRALLWAKRGAVPGKSVLLGACLNDLRYDGQCEEPRGDWLWQIVEAAGAIEDFREPILESLGRLYEGLAAQQLCQFAVSYGMRGDHRFRDTLRRIVSEKPVPDCPWLGEEQLVELDGTVGFLFAAKVRALSLPGREWDWDDEAVVDSAVEKYGRQTVIELVEQESESTPELREFLEAWRVARETRATNSAESHRERMRQYTLDDAIRVAEGTLGPAGLLRGWGMYASESDLQSVLDRMFAADRPVVIANYLRVFSNRPLPSFDERLLEFLGHEDERVRHWAYSAVALNAHPSVRKFALDHLPACGDDGDLAELFVRNYRRGDEELLCAHLHLPDDQDARHGLLMAVRKILEANHAARCDVLALWVYRWTPCALCRYGVAKLLIEKDVAPEWLPEECRYDSYSDTRQLVEGGGS